MQKTSLALMIMGLLFVTSACQPPANMSDKSKESESSNSVSTSTKTTDQPTSEPLIEAKTARALTTAIVALSEERLTNELICIKLDDAMQAIDNKSKFEDVHAIQRQLEACLPITDNVEVLQWLEDYQALYGRFLDLEKDANEENFYTLMSMTEQGKKPTVALLRAASPRLRYLIGLIQSNADVSVLYLGEGEYTFHHDLKAMADLFSPYLTADQNEFVQQLAKENQDIFWNDAGVAIPFAELLKRAIFWENYIQRYPDGYAITDAKDLFNTYRYVLFFGSENTQWTDEAFREFYRPEDEQLIRQLATSSNKILAQDARKFLNFMTLSDSERQQQYPAPSKNDNGDKMDDRAITRYQVEDALSLPSPWDTASRDCSDGVICVDRDFG